MADSAALVTSRGDSEAIGLLCRSLSERGIEVRRVDPTDARAMALLRATRVGLLDFAGGGDIATVAEHAIETSARTLWIALVGEGMRWTPTLRSMIWQTCFLSVSTEDPPERIADAVALSLRHARFAPDNEHERGGECARIEGFVGESAPMRTMFERMVRIAQTDASVLISGESGTGKELIARTLHERSARRAKPFVAVNCGALPSQLIASELFGHERGAFTGAATQRVGRLEQADGGTLLLDEIGDLPADAQTYLLRALQEGVVERLGGTKQIAVDVRIVAATHVDLDEAVAAGRFRLDLYHRLKVLEIRVPPLRERGSDIQSLAEHFLERFRGEAGRSIRGFAPEAVRAMLLHSWPGNVRELGNRVRQAVVMAEGAYLTADDLGLDPGGGDASEKLWAMRERAEVDAIRNALIRSGRNFSRTAQSLGISRMTLYRLIQKHQDALRDVTGPLATRTVELPAPRLRALT